MKGAMRPERAMRIESSEVLSATAGALLRGWAPGPAVTILHTSAALHEPYPTCDRASRAASRWASPRGCACAMPASVSGPAFASVQPAVHDIVRSGSKREELTHADCFVGCHR